MELENVRQLKRTQEGSSALDERPGIFEQVTEEIKKDTKDEIDAKLATSGTEEDIAGRHAKISEEVIQELKNEVIGFQAHVSIDRGRINLPSKYPDFLNEGEIFIAIFNDSQAGSAQPEKILVLSTATNLLKNPKLKADFKGHTYKETTSVKEEKKGGKRIFIGKPILREIGWDCDSIEEANKQLADEEKCKATIIADWKRQILLVYPRKVDLVVKPGSLKDLYSVDTGQK